MKSVEIFENVACDICGSYRAAVLYRFSLTGTETNIVECQNCSCVYLCPRPTSNHIADFYGDDYYSFSINDQDDFNSISAKESLRRTVMKHHFGYTNIDATATLRIPSPVSALFKSFVAVPHFRENGRLLDVGCGAGQKLLEFKSLGWDVRGLEISQQAAAKGREMGLEIATRALSEVPWPAGSFSAITFYHSLEHLPSPRLALREAFKLMDAGGELLVAVPNFGCLERRLFGRNWSWLDVPIHFHHFTKATLTRIISEAGFSVDAIGFSSSGCSASIPFLNRSPVARGLSDKALRLFGVACSLAGSGKALIVSARK